MFPHFLLYLLLLFIYYLLLSFILLFILPSSSLAYEHCLPPNSCYMMAANVTHCLFFIYLFFFLVLFYLHILSYTSLPLLCYFIFCFILTCGIYHKTALFKGHWFLPYFSHIPSPSTPYIISFTLFHFLLCVFSPLSHSSVMCFFIFLSLHTDPSTTTHLWAVCSYWFIDSPRTSLLFHIFIQYCCVSLLGLQCYSEDGSSRFF
jgi:hypothetical protein